MKSLLFISSNEIWSGSEELWFASAIQLSKKKSVAAITRYEHNRLSLLREYSINHYILGERWLGLTLMQRIINRFYKIFKSKDQWQALLKKIDASFAIISQGNNLDSVEIMSWLEDNSIPFVTITQLVTDFHWLSFDADRQKKLKHLYTVSLHNFFVSQDNLKIHELMMCLPNANNNSVVFNPYRLSEKSEITFPDFSGIYKVAFVGRIECLHKGLDILIQVIMMPKWQERNIEFNFYGDGPHKLILEQITKEWGIKNVFFKDHQPDVLAIWKQNHILILPSRMEGQALSLIEALFNKRTAIVTNVGGAAELIDDNISGFIAPHASVDLIDDAMERAWQSRAEWDIMGQRAYQKILQFFPEDSVDFFVEKLGKIVVL